MLKNDKECVASFGKKIFIYKAEHISIKKAEIPAEYAFLPKKDGEYDD